MTFFIEIKITNFKNLTIKLYVFEILNTHVKFCANWILWAPNVRLLGLTFAQAHNLFVLWAFEFSTVGGPILGCLSMLLLLKPFSLPHNHFLSQCNYSFQCSPQNCQPPFLILIYYLQLKIRGGVMIILCYQWVWRSNSITFKWMFS